MERPNIILTTRPVIWNVSLDHQMLYERISQQTSYNAKQASEPISDDHIVLEDDKPLINYYISLAISDLTSLLARRIDPSVVVTDAKGARVDNPGMVEGDNATLYTLVVDENFESTLQSALQRYCFEYVASRVMEMWYKTPQDSDAWKSSIIRTLDFRKKPVRRPIRNFL